MTSLAAAASSASASSSSDPSQGAVVQLRQARQAQLAPLLGPVALQALGLATRGLRLRGEQERLAVAAGANVLHAFPSSVLLCLKRSA